MTKNEKRYKKNIREIVEEYLEYAERPTIDEIVDIIRPHYRFTKQQLIERELLKKARYIMRSFKDDNGVRTYFSNNDGIYINVENTDDMDDLQKVNKQLNRKMTGLTGAIKKVVNRIMNLAEKFMENY